MGSIYTTTMCLSILRFGRPRVWIVLEKSIGKSFQIPIFGRRAPHVRNATFLEHFLWTRESTHVCKAGMKKVQFISIEWCKKCWIFLQGSPFLKALQPVAVLEFCVEITGTDNIGRGCFWYDCLYINSILLPVKFKDRLSISILRNKTSLQKIGAQNRRVLRSKRSNFLTLFKRRIKGPLVALFNRKKRRVNELHYCRKGKDYINVLLVRLMGGARNLFVLS